MDTVEVILAKDMDFGACSICCILMILIVHVVEIGDNYVYSSELIFVLQPYFQKWEMGTVHPFAKCDLPKGAPFLPGSLVQSSGLEGTPVQFFE